MRYNLLGKTGLYVSELAATVLQLSREQVAQLNEASALPPEYPAWMVEFQNSRDPRDATPPMSTSVEGR